MVENSSVNDSTNGAPRRYYALLASVLALAVLGPLVEHSVAGRVLVGCLSIASMACGTLAAKAGKKESIVAVVLACLTCLAWISSLLPHGPSASSILQTLAYAVTLAFAGLIMLVMMKDIFTNEVNGNRVAGAICVYVLLGISFAIIHMTVLLYDHNAYKDSSGDQLIDRYNGVSAANDFPLFVYYSFCTLSTVGYGDVVPVGHLARTISWLEAITGQIYLTVLVARLVGLHIASSTGPASGSNLSSSALISKSADALTESD